MNIRYIKDYFCLFSLTLILISCVPEGKSNKKKGSKDSGYKGVSKYLNTQISRPFALTVSNEDSNNIQLVWPDPFGFYITNIRIDVIAKSGVSIESCYEVNSNSGSRESLDSTPGLLALTTNLVNFNGHCPFVNKSIPFSNIHGFRICMNKNANGFLAGGCREIKISDAVNKRVTFSFDIDSLEMGVYSPAQTAETFDQDYVPQNRYSSTEIDRLTGAIQEQIIKFNNLNPITDPLRETSARSLITQTINHADDILIILRATPPSQYYLELEGIRNRTTFAIGSLQTSIAHSINRFNNVTIGIINDLNFARDLLINADPSQIVTSNAPLLTVTRSRVLLVGRSYTGKRSFYKKQLSDAEKNYKKALLDAQKRADTYVPPTATAKTSQESNQNQNVIFNINDLNKVKIYRYIDKSLQRHIVSTQSSTALNNRLGSKYELEMQAHIFSSNQGSPAHLIKPLYNCFFGNNSEIIPSLDRNCEGSKGQNEKIGYILQEERPGFVPIYRCRKAYGRYFVSGNIDCEGLTTVGRIKLGYVN